MPADSVLESKDEVRVVGLIEFPAEAGFTPKRFLEKLARTSGNPLDDLLGLLARGFLGQLQQFQDEGLQETNGGELGERAVLHLGIGMVCEVGLLVEKNYFTGGGRGAALTS